MSKRAGIFRGTWMTLAGGALAFLALFAFTIWISRKFSVMGVSDPTISTIVRERFSDQVIQFVTIIGGVYFLLGLWFAVPAAFLRKEGSFFLGFFCSLSAAAAFFANAAGYRPALYAPWLYDLGGFPAELQKFLAYEPRIGLLLLFPAAGLFLMRAFRTKNAPALVAFAAVASVTWWGMFHRDTVDVVAAPAQEKKPDIVLIASDSVRPDRLGCYGSQRGASPNIDRLCADGTMFEEAYVPLPRTFPSWASMLSGQPPWVHGIRNMFPDPKDAILPEDLPRWLAREGYYSAVFADYAGDIFPRFDAGFDKIDAPPFTFLWLIKTETLAMHRFLLPFVDTPLGRRIYPQFTENADTSDAALLTDKVLAYLGKPTRNPRFTAIFYSTTHFPFATNYPDVGRFSDPGYRGPFYFKKPTLPGEAPPLTDADRAQILDLFDNCIYSVDRQVGRLVSAIRAAPGGANTVVLFTADHGENLYEENDDLGHGDHFRGNRTLQVPLILSAPGRIPQGLRVPGLVSSMDIAPTFAALAGARTPDNLEGRDLLAMARGEIPAHEKLFFETGIWFVDVAKGYLEKRRIRYPDITAMGEIDYAGDTSVSVKPEYLDITNIAKHRMVFDGRYKLLYIPTPRGIKWELFDLLYDPEEKEDISAESPDLVRALARALGKEVGTAPGAEIRRNFFLPKEVAR